MCLFGEGFLDLLFDGPPRLARSLLDSANQFMLHSLLVAEIVIGQLAPSLFEFPLGERET